MVMSVMKRLWLLCVVTQLPMAFTTKCSVAVCDGTTQWAVTCKEDESMGSFHFRMAKRRAAKGELTMGDLTQCQMLVLNRNGCGDCSLCSMGMIADDEGYDLMQHVNVKRRRTMPVPCKCFMTVPEYVEMYGSCVDCVAKGLVPKSGLNELGRQALHTKMGANK